jgi:hypothetical protein
MMPGHGIDKLGRDTDLVIDLPDAALQNVSHPQLAAHLRDLHRLVLVREDRITRDDRKPADPGKIGDDVVSDAVREVLLLRVVAHVREGKHGHGRFVAYPRPLDSRGRVRRERGLGVGAGPHPIHPHRFIDVFERVLAEWLAHERQLARDLVTHRTRDAHTPTFGKPLDARSDIDSVSVNSVTLDNDLAEIDPDSEVHAAVHRQIGVSRIEFLLDTDRALDGIHNAGKLREKTIPSGVHHAPAMLADEHGHRLPIVCEHFNGRDVVYAHQAAVFFGIGTEDRGEPTLDLGKILRDGAIGGAAHGNLLP